MCHGSTWSPCGRLRLGWKVSHNAAHCMRAAGPIDPPARRSQAATGLRLRRVVAGAVLCALCSTGAVAGTVYRWVDEQGKVHYSDLVPERYRNTAKPVDAPPAEPTPEQQRAALERAQSEKAKALAPSVGRSGPTESAQPASAASAPSRKRPPQVPNDQTDCDTWQRLYMESIDCFGPYRTVRGGVKPEAFEVCNVVREPPPTRCRMHIP
mgnify:CR=1 FL=1